MVANRSLTSDRDRPVTNDAGPARPSNPVSSYARPSACRADATVRSRSARSTAGTGV